MLYSSTVSLVPRLQALLFLGNITFIFLVRLHLDHHLPHTELCYDEHFFGCQQIAFLYAIYSSILHTLSTKNKNSDLKYTSPVPYK